MTLTIPPSLLPASRVACEAPGNTPYFFSLHTQPELRHILSHNFTTFIESGGHHAMQQAFEQATCAGDDFSLSITAASAYKLPLANELTHYIGQRFGLYDCMETCLQEALINAIIHGSLDIDMQFRTVCGFNDYCELVDNGYAGKYVRYEHRQPFRAIAGNRR